MFGGNVSSQASTPARARATAALSWTLTIACNVLAPVLTYNQLTSSGWSASSALIVCGVWPFLDAGVHLAWRRHVDEFALVTLIFLALTAIVTLIGAHSVRLLLVKDSAVTGLFGVLCLVTLAAPRPMMFYFGRRFATDGTKQSVAWWNGLWVLAGFRRALRNMTLVWGLAYVIEALVRIGLSYLLPTGSMVVVNPTLAYGILGLLAAWTIACAKRTRAKLEAAASPDGR